MKTFYSAALILIPCLVGCAPSDSVTSASVTLLNKPALPVTTDGESMTIPVGVTAYVAFDVAGKNGAYLGAFDVESSNPNVVDLLPDTPTAGPKEAETCNDAPESSIVTKYLVYGASVGTTTLHVRPTRKCANDGDGGDILIPITVTAQTP